MRESWCAPMANVIVTGGSRGLGLGIAQRLAATGYTVIAIARQESKALGAAMLEVAESRSGALHFKPFDLGKIAEVPELIRQIRGQYGPVYGLVNNAGLGTSGILASMNVAQMEQLVLVNILSPMVVTKCVVRSMMADGGGRIVNISSIVGFTGFKGLSVYGATKASLIGFTRSLAREVGALGINVNAVAPGFIDTDMTHGLAGGQRERIVRRSALHRLTDIEDVADAVDFLLGSRSKSITGTVVTVDAGGTA
jgi:3-oxoacyl-[acyl-carrier protein] reductase